MKLILLPGLNGTGNLFNAFLSQYPEPDVQVLTLSQSGKQDYDTLTDNIYSRLPE